MRRDVSRHFAERGRDELVDHDLRAVREVAVLRLPQRRAPRVRPPSSRTRSPCRRTRRAASCRPRTKRSQSSRCCIGAYVSSVRGSCSTRCRCENVPRCDVLTGQPHRDAVDDERRKGERLGVPPVDAALDERAARRASWRASFGCTVKSSGVRSSCSFSTTEAVLGDGGHDVALRGARRQLLGLLLRFAERCLQSLVRLAQLQSRLRRRAHLPARA